jgi:hypothetical protein
VVVFLPYSHHPHLPLDYCSHLGLDLDVHLYLHIHFDQVLMRVDWCHLGWFIKVDYLDLAVLYHLL